MNERDSTSCIILYDTIYRISYANQFFARDSTRRAEYGATYLMVYGAGCYTFQYLYAIKKKTLYHVTRHRVDFTHLLYQSMGDIIQIHTVHYFRIMLHVVQFPRIRHSTRTYRFPITITPVLFITVSYRVASVSELPHRHGYKKRNPTHVTRVGCMLYIHQFFEYGIEIQELV